MEILSSLNMVKFCKGQYIISFFQSQGYQRVFQEKGAEKIIIHIKQIQFLQINLC